MLSIFSYACWPSAYLLLNHRYQLWEWRLCILSKMNDTSAKVSWMCSESNLTLSVKGQSEEVFRKGIVTLSGKPADQEDGGLVSQRTILCAVLNRSVVSDSLRPLWTWLTRHLCPWGFSRQEYWSGFLCATSGDLPIPAKIQASLYYQRRGCGWLLQTSWCQNPLFL